MEIKSVRKGHAEKVVVVADAEENTNADIIAFATKAANEAPSSLFGTSLRWVDDFAGPRSARLAVVSLHTD
jgi:hypothetical protein